MSHPLRVAMVSNVLPHIGIPHAGGQYLRQLVAEVETFADLTVIVPNVPTARAAAQREGLPRKFVIAGGSRSATVPGRACTRAAVVSYSELRRLDPGLPSFPMALDLLRDKQIRTVITNADVIDLQWSECIRLAPLVRRLNPKARIIATFHDVQSQLFSREADAAEANPRYWRAVAARARRSERAAVRRVDEIIVFSEKDAHLLGDPAQVRVVRPPLATATLTPHSPPDVNSPVVLFVSHLSRPENDEGARWFLTHVWPAVARACPTAVFRLVGAGASDSLIDLARRSDSVSMAGFVDDLDAEYAAATVCVVPLHFGAGVKFKTVEALTRGVPVVTTEVGAEGIGGSELFSLLSEDVKEWVSALIGLLDNPRASHDRAARTQEWAHAAYGTEGFTREIRAAYGWLAEGADTLTGRSDQPKESA